MQRSLLLPLACWALGASSAAQTTWYVDDDACPAPGAGTQADPFCAIQAAIDAAASGDTVLVLPGTYSSLDFQGKDVAVRSVAGPGESRIDGGDGATVRFVAGEGPGAVLQGFDIRGGEPVIVCDGSSPTISSNIIRLGSSGNGGGLQIFGGAAPLVLSNEIRDNFADPGGIAGGFFVNESSPRFENNVVHHNRVSQAFDLGGSFGGGGFVRNSTVSFVGNLFHANTCGDALRTWGGGLYAVGSTVTFRGNTFVGNVAADGELGAPGIGGAIALASSVAVFDNHVSWDNVATHGPELGQLSTGNVHVSYSLVEGGLGAVHMPTGVVWGAGNLDTDPLFVDPAAEDYHVLPSSPVVDAGVPTTPTGGTDADLDPRILDGDGDGAQRRDMGWDEVNPSGLLVVGTPAIGVSLTLMTTGPQGHMYGLGFALGTIDLALPPYGSLLIDPATLRVIALGSVPGADAIAVPPDPALIGMRVFFQALVRHATAAPGSFTRRVELTVRG